METRPGDINVSDVRLRRARVYQIRNPVRDAFLSRLAYVMRHSVYALLPFGGDVSLVEYQPHFLLALPVAYIRRKGVYLSSHTAFLTFSPCQRPNLSNRCPPLRSVLSSRPLTLLPVQLPVPRLSCHPLLLRIVASASPTQTKVQGGARCSRR